VREHEHAHEEGRTEICERCEGIFVFLQIIKDNISKLSLCKIVCLLHAVSA